MSNEKMPLVLDEMEASLALHALRFYINAKGYEVSHSTTELESKLDAFLNGTTFVVSQVESVASLLGARGGTKGGASTSEEKKAAAVANGAKGGRPRKPNLFIRFHASFWNEPDPKLMNRLNILSGRTDWQPEQPEGQTHGPYVRMYVDYISDHLSNLLSTSMNVISWDNKPFLAVCDEHKMEPSTKLAEDIIELGNRCDYCPRPSRWVC
jgi:hypothetical protein